MALLQLSSTRSHYAAARCSRCHRPLTDPDSIRRGMGPECSGRGSGSSERDLCNRDQFSDEFDGTIRFEKALVLKRRPGERSDKGSVVTNVPHLVVHHSPDGYEFGYAGSGPADLALNACQLYLNMTGYEGRQTKCYDGKCWGLAWKLHQEFKIHFIASAPQTTGRIIPFAEIDAWFKTHITSETLEQYAIQKEEE